MTRAASRCDECGAPVDGDLDCRSRLEGLLAWEWSDPALQAVHFLTVTAYNLQHPAQFSDEALDGLWVSLGDYLDGTATVHDLRRRARAAFDGPRRVLRREEERRPRSRAWSLTVATVYPGGGPHAASERVRAWAEAVRAERRPPHA